MFALANIFFIELQAENKAKAEKMVEEMVEEMCQKMLINSDGEYYQFTVKEV